MFKRICKHFFLLKHASIVPGSYNRLQMIIISYLKPYNWLQIKRLTSTVNNRLAIIKLTINISLSLSLSLSLSSLSLSLNATAYNSSDFRLKSLTYAG